MAVDPAAMRAGIERGPLDSCLPYAPNTPPLPPLAPSPGALEEEGREAGREAGSERGGEIRYGEEEGRGISSYPEEVEGS